MFYDGIYTFHDTSIDFFTDREYNLFITLV